MALLRNKAPIALGLLLMATLNAHADNDSVYVVDQDLGDVVKEYGRNAGVLVEVDPDVKVRVRNQRIPLGAQFLQFVQQRYGVGANKDGDVLHFTSLSTYTTRLFVLNKLTISELTRATAAVGIDLHKFDMRKIPGNNAIVLTAPPAVLGHVEALINSLPVKSQVNEMVIIRAGRVERVED